MTEPDPSGYWRRLRRQKAEILNVRPEGAGRTGCRACSPGRRRASRIRFFCAGRWSFTPSGRGPGPIQGVHPWGPSPFALLTRLASTQAPGIGLLILIYEERQSHVGELREETGLQISLHVERETTKLLREVHVKPGHEELQEMARRFDAQRLHSATDESLQRAED